MQAEKAIEQYLVRCVKQRGGLCIKLQNTGLNGIPDRMVLFKDNVTGKGKIVFCELKAPCGRLSEVQKARHRQLAKMGFSVYTLWNFEQVDWFLLKEIENESAESGVYGGDFG